MKKATLSCWVRQIVQIFAYAGSNPVAVPMETRFNVIEGDDKIEMMHFGDQKGLRYFISSLIQLFAVILFVPFKTIQVMLFKRMADEAKFRRLHFYWSVKQIYDDKIVYIPFQYEENMGYKSAWGAVIGELLIAFLYLLTIIFLIADGYWIITGLLLISMFEFRHHMLDLKALKNGWERIQSN